MKRERNRVTHQIHKLVREEKEQEIRRELEPIEKAKDDSNKMFAAVRGLQRLKPKKPLVIKTTDGLTTDTDLQIEVIESFFKEMFNSETAEKLEAVPPTKMTNPFTQHEIKTAIDSMKNGKSAGVDNIIVEQLKYGPTISHQIIAEMFNKIADTGAFPNEIKEGLLIPLQKPGKEKGPPCNLRPIILLSTVRKILAICLIKRIGGKIDNSIPLSQASYRSGRGTTEQLFAMKLLAEKAVTSIDYNTHILMMDMSKAFDTVSRNTVIEDLNTILDRYELHLVKIMLEDVKLSIKVNGKIGNPFTTNIGTPQGDCMSPILFTLYLANALKPPQTTQHLTEHNYSKPNDDLCKKTGDQEARKRRGHLNNEKNIQDKAENEKNGEVETRKIETVTLFLSDILKLLPNKNQAETIKHREAMSTVIEKETIREDRRAALKEKRTSEKDLMETRQKEKRAKVIPLQYADDICWIGVNSSDTIEAIKQKTPGLLSRRNLTINPDKTEEFIINKESEDTSWKTCKYLGTCLDTGEDIKRRKRLANGAMANITHITKDKNISQKIKLRAFNAYIAPIFLYNSETWTLTKAKTKSIDVIHRTFLRRILNIRWPRTISNTELYSRTSETPWSEKVETRRLRFLGHILRLPAETPVREALAEYQLPWRRPVGAPRQTWMKTVENDLKRRGLTYSQAEQLALDRKNWRSLVANRVLGSSNTGVQHTDV